MRLLAACLFLLIFPLTIQAALIRAPEVVIWDGASVQTKFQPMKWLRNPVAQSLFVADLGKDGIAEFLVGSGSGLDPLVGIYRINGSRIFQFWAFPARMKYGVNVAAADLDGDGVREILVSAAYGGPATVKVFDNYGRVKKPTKLLPGSISSFEAFEKDFTGGVVLAAADFDRDRKSEIVAASGPGRVGEVVIFSNLGVKIKSFFPFGESYRDGVAVTVADIDGDGIKEIVTGESSKGSSVKIFKVGDRIQSLTPWRAYAEQFVGGLNLNAIDLNSDGKEEIIVAPNGAGGPHLKIFSGAGALLKEWFAYEKSFSGGVALGVGQVDKDATSEIATLPKPPLYEPQAKPGHAIAIDLSEQRLYAWNDGYLARTFLISSGLRSTPTPVGEFSILKKPLFVNYTRVYGQDDPRNYDFPNTRYNLMFKPHYYIHTAWWHNNFGAPMSHGCVNTHVDNAEWIYAWADLGTPVSIKQKIGEAQLAKAAP